MSGNDSLGVPSNSVTFWNADSAFLMAEDDHADAALFSKMLSTGFADQCTVVCVDRFEKVTAALDQGAFQALILDMNLPDQSGKENVRALSQRYPNLPIVILTGDDDTGAALDSLQLGAQDYLNKNNVTPESLARSVQFARTRKLLELELKNALEASSIENEKLESQANHDSLTGLANRAYFDDMALRMLMRTRRKNQRAAMLYLDLNNFKQINDKLGHATGDVLLKEVAARLQGIVRKGDLLARLGGDEFVIFTDSIVEKSEVYPLVARVQQQFDAAFQLGEQELSVTPSIGISFFPDADNLELLIRQSDCAMYQAKSCNSTNACFYSDEIEARYARIRSIEDGLRHAVENHKLTAEFQPMISVVNGEGLYLEALARWKSDDSESVSPGEFIPLAENTPMIDYVSDVVRRESELLYQAALNRGKKIDKISINLSTTQLASLDFCQRFVESCQSSLMGSESIIVELPAQKHLEDPDNFLEQVNLFEESGVQIALDDFGSGVAPLSYLVALPLQYLKLDTSLTRDIDARPRNQALVAGIVEVAHRLGIRVVAKGIETAVEMQTAIDLGCDYMQGFLFSQPLPLDGAARYCEFRSA